MQFPSGFYTSGSGGQQFAQRPMQMMAPGYPQQMMPQQMWGQPQPQYRSPPAGQAMYRQAQQVPQQMQQARRPATAPAPQYRNVGMQRVGQPLVQQQHQQQQQQQQQQRVGPPHQQQQQQQRVQRVQQVQPTQRQQQSAAAEAAQRAQQQKALPQQQQAGIQARVAGIQQAPRAQQPLLPKASKQQNVIPQQPQQYAVTKAQPAPQAPPIQHQQQARIIPQQQAPATDNYGTGIKLREVPKVGLQVMRLTPGSAAALSGAVSIGDMLVGIDGYTLPPPGQQLDLDIIREKLAGARGSRVTLKFRRQSGGQLREADLVRNVRSSRKPADQALARSGRTTPGAYGGLSSLLTAGGSLAGGSVAGYDGEDSMTATIAIGHSSESAPSYLQGYSPSNGEEF